MKNFFSLFLTVVFVIATSNIAESQSQEKVTIAWVKAYLKQNPKTGIAFRYGKAEYIGLSDKSILDQMGAVEYDKTKFDQLRNTILNVSQQTNGLKNAKILDTTFDDVVAEKDRAALIAFMNTNDLELIQIIDFTPLFTGIRDGKNGLSGNITGVRYNLFIESKFYFKTLLQDKSKSISDCRADFDWLSITAADETNKPASVSFAGMANNPSAKQNAIDSIAANAYKSKNFNNGMASYKGLSSYSELNSKYDGIVFELMGDNLKINIKRANVKGLAALASNVPANYSVVERVKGDNPITFWKETEYDIVVAAIKINESIDDYSICGVTGISNGFTKEKLVGLQVASGATYGIGGHLPVINESMQLVGKRLTLEEFASKSGVATVDKNYYDTKPMLHPSTTITSGKPNVVPKKERTLLQKVRRFESEGKKIAVVFNPGFVKFENPATATMGAAQTASSSSPCEFEAGFVPFSDNYLATGKDVTDALNKGFNTTIFEYVDAKKIERKEIKMLGQVVGESYEWTTTQYNIAVEIDLSGTYSISGANAANLYATMALTSQIKVNEIEPGKKSPKGIAFQTVSVSVTKDAATCPATINDVISYVGPIETYADLYKEDKDKKLSSLIASQNR